MTRVMAKLMVWVALAHATARAQQSAPVKLGRPTGELRETFTFVSSVRELSDGRVLLTDPSDNRIVVADFASNRIQPVSRIGGGPGEYQNASPLYALSGDSSLMPDMLNRRWLILQRDRVVATLPPDSRAIVAVGDEVVMGTDGRGNVLSRTGPLIPSGRSTTTAKDSVWIIRVAVTSGRIDTIARVRAARMTSEVMRDDRGNIASIRQAIPNPYATEEPVAQCADGWLAVVRFDPYRIDWRSPAGVWTRGAPIVLEALVRLTGAEKRAYMARIARARGDTARSPDEFSEWPAQMPPVERQSVFTAVCSPDGLVLVNRTKSIAHPESRYDIVDRRGVPVRQLALAPGEHIVGFGKRTVYVVLIDDDGAQHVRRHAWP